MMSDVLAIFGVLIFLGVTFPALLAAAWLLFPRRVESARFRLEHSPWRCLVMGALLAVVLALPIVGLTSAPAGPLKLLGWVLLAFVLSFALLGGAGLAAVLGVRLAAHSGAGLPPQAAFLRAALILELAGAFPGLGWLVFFPLATLASLGAAALALFDRRVGSAQNAPAPTQPASQPAGQAQA
jgi:hypothetical protein